MNEKLDILKAEMNKIKTMLSTLGATNSTMGFGQHANAKEVLSEELLKEVRLAAPNARLSYVLRSSLERYDKAERREIVSVICKEDSCSALFTACKKGNLEIVEYLVDFCGADLEQKGIYEVPDDKTNHTVTPLWCAAVSGRLEIVKYLVKKGANVNTASDSGSTPVRSACFMTHFDIVQFLVEHGNANIHIPNNNCGSCLINSVQSKDLCEYLIKHGADVNAQDIQLKTALHYAIQEHRFETTKLLLSHGACPFLKNRYGDDALQTASLKGAALIFNYLLENISYSRERQAEMYELMGSTFLDEHHDVQMALEYWKKALDIRFRPAGDVPPLPKRKLNYVPLYARGFLDPMTGEEMLIEEFANHEEYRNVAVDMDLIKINSLLMAERILGKNHKDMIFRIMYRGAAYADSSQYLLCILCWRYTLQLRIEKDSIVYGDTCYAALALIRLLLDLDRNREIDRNTPNHPLRIIDLLEIYEMLIHQLIISVELIEIRPVFKRQLDSFDKSLRGCTHFLYLLLRAPNKTPTDYYKIQKCTQKLLHHNLKTCSNGDSPLHLAVSRSNVVRSHFFVDELQPCVFPSLEVAKFLLCCGADVNAVNDSKATPLHLVVSNEGFDVEIANMLIRAGAHIDQLDSQNQRPLDTLNRRQLPGLEYSPIDHITLKCLSSRAVCAYDIPFRSEELPQELRIFLELHRPKKVNTEDE